MSNIWWNLENRCVCCETYDRRYLPCDEYRRPERSHAQRQPPSPERWSGHLRRRRLKLTRLVYQLGFRSCYHCAISNNWRSMNGGSEISHPLRVRILGMDDVVIDGTLRLTGFVYRPYAKAAHLYRHDRYTYGRRTDFEVVLCTKRRPLDLGTERIVGSRNAQSGGGESVIVDWFGGRAKKSTMTTATSQRSFQIGDYLNVLELKRLRREQRRLVSRPQSADTWFDDEARDLFARWLVACEWIIGDELKYPPLYHNRKKPGRDGQRGRRRRYHRRLENTIDAEQPRPKRSKCPPPKHPVLLRELSMVPTATRIVEKKQPLADWREYQRQLERHFDERWDYIDEESEGQQPPFRNSFERDKSLVYPTFRFSRWCEIVTPDPPVPWQIYNDVSDRVLYSSRWATWDEDEWDQRSVRIWSKFLR